ncbi:GNAT family N-acetyltransferase [Sphingorhabdus sp. Alg239-R122]|uniref:GNAT family N-acetyltransferase n=1 Tax=Sphingorhabdus sp. Alg239-R122 TaxID=2305989 RepID=UPI0013D979A2|nr:GNAT family N-acetyltransferase [Sphingorhabdus sp. Alg239-R122]
MFTRTQRLLLRPGWPEDWRALAGAMNDEGIVCNLARAPWPYTDQDAREFANREQDPLYPVFFLTLPGDQGSELIGACGIDKCGDDVELGYWVARPHWGKGYASEAGRAVADIAAVLGHTRLVAAHFADNPASGRVLEKIGFTATGGSVMRYSKGRDAKAMTYEFAMDLAALTPEPASHELQPLAA